MDVKKLNTTSPWSNSQWNTTAWKDVPNPFEGTFLESPASAYWCYHNQEKCLLNVGKYLTYDCPKNAVEISWNAAKWTGNQAVTYIDLFFSKAYKKLGAENPPKTETLGASLYSKVRDSFNQLNEETTSWILEKNKGERELTATIESKTDVPFSAIDLIGPALLMGYTANKALDNAKSVLFNFYLLLSGKRTITTTYRSTPQMQTMSINSPRDFMHTKPYTTNKILLNIVMESLFAGAFGAGAYLSFQGIEEALIGAGCETARAHMLTKALLVGMTAIPNLYSFAKVCVENEDSVVGPASTPHLAYTDSADFVAIDIENSDKPNDDEPQNKQSSNPLGLMTNSGSGLKFF